MTVNHNGRLVPMIPFKDWPFELLEVDLSSKRKPDHWCKTDSEMAEAIRKEAQKGGINFTICYGEGNKWKYEINFADWTQLNVGTKTVRKLRFGVP
jgi:hypothetical protein